MPIQAGIINQLQPVQTTDLAEQRLKQQELQIRAQALQHQMQMQPLQLEAERQLAEERRIGNEEKRSTLDRETRFRNAVAAGAKPFELMSIDPKLADTHLKGIAEQDKANLEKSKSQVQAMGSLLGSVVNAPDTEKEARYQAAVTQARQMGLIQEGHEPPPNYDPAYVDQHFQAAISADKQIDNHRQELERLQRLTEQAPKTAKEWTDYILKEAGATTSQADLDQLRTSLSKIAGIPQGLIERNVPAMWSPAAVADIQNRALTPEQRQQAAHNKVMENEPTEWRLRLKAAQGDAAAKKALADAQAEKIRVAQVEAQNRMNIQMGAMGGANGEPSEMAKAVANYEVPLQQILSRTPPAMRDTIIAQIRKLNPDFRETNYDMARATELDAVKGKIATTSNAQNTALAHMETLNQAIDALKNGDIKILNKLGNGLGVQTGNTAKTTFDAIVHKVGPELASAYLAGGGSVGERGATEKDFDPSLSPEQLRSNIAVSAKLLAGKIKANQDQYDRGTGGRGKQKLLSDDAKAALDKLQGAGGGTGVAPIQLKDGRTLTPHTQADADRFRKEHPELIK